MPLRNRHVVEIARPCPDHEATTIGEVLVFADSGRQLPLLLLRLYPVVILR